MQITWIIQCCTWLNFQFDHSTLAIIAFVQTWMFYKVFWPPTSRDNQCWTSSFGVSYVNLFSVCTICRRPHLFIIVGNSYTTYMKEEIGSYRIVIGNQTCSFEQETDPSVLRWVIIMIMWSCALYHRLYQSFGHYIGANLFGECHTVKQACLGLDWVQSETLHIDWRIWQGTAGPQTLRMSRSLAMAEFSVESFALFMWGSWSQISIRVNM